MRYSMHLAPHIFEKVIAGEKTIEARLFDEKRQQFDIGDTIIFIHRETGDECAAEITGLMQHENFRDLFNASGETEFGYDSFEAALTDIYTFYSSEDEERSGVLGVCFDIIK